ncbi:hypothetical protein Nepgr_009878 [Nepenthes gracilis]|uniref:RIN4 pathogenic type III effector avirulence factor Avr cleavage site domain-containing protein n=1 Tax=Nepenthes gracilis TaxID=150966 RepID=A0AAD3XKJ7_NEPGR|nr:hypothetical protein Nepgr_009878 [Nepenthes gracilis]
MANSTVPKFGDWENQDIPFTEYFEKARKAKSGKTMNLDDPHYNYDLDSDSFSSAQSHALLLLGKRKALGRIKAVRPKHELQVNQEDDELQRPTDYPSHHDIDRRAATESTHQHHAGVNPSETPGMAVMTNMGNDGGTHDLAPSTPGRLWLRSTRGNETPADHAAAVPKFGEWDEDDPTSADGYSQIFNRVRQERHNGAAVAPSMAPNARQSHGDGQSGSGNSKSWCCFPWAGN